jgi:hypothetical protein
MNVIMAKETTKQPKNSKGALIFNPRIYQLKMKPIFNKISFFTSKGQTSYLEARAILSHTIRATKKQSDSDFDVKCATVQFYKNSHNSQSDHWIDLKV